MRSFTILSALLTALALGSPGAAAQSSNECVTKSGEGIGTTEEAARFQAHQSILQSTDNWLAWLATGRPRDAIKVTYACRRGGTLGNVCVATATVCRR